MERGPAGENLIFLISQPRAGSTLLQRVLGGHPAIHTVSEPWLMLHPVYALRDRGHSSEFGAAAGLTGLRSFLATLPAGEDDYIAALRLMGTFLYARALEASGKPRFLDKTPRYYLIIGELDRVFPSARYVLLFRNPLAVLSSILTSWVHGNWLRLPEFRHDLLRAPSLLLRARDALGPRAVVVHYEAFVGTPDAETHRICESLGLDYVPGILEYGRSNQPRWRFGDPTRVYAHTKPVRDHVHAWADALGDPQAWRLASDYLEYLGPDLTGRMGYVHGELRRDLDRRRPAASQLWRTLPLAWFLEEGSLWPARGKRAVVRLKIAAERWWRGPRLPPAPDSTG